MDSGCCPAYPIRCPPQLWRPTPGADVKAPLATGKAPEDRRQGVEARIMSRDSCLVGVHSSDNINARMPKVRGFLQAALDSEAAMLIILTLVIGYFGFTKTVRA